ncbi:MAG: GTP-binding protein [Candidatus Helarchaeota archaeon]
MATVWQPDDISLDVRNLVSLKTIQILAGESGRIPKSLAIIPFPSINLKGLVKYLEIKETSKRGGGIDSSLTLLFNEADDLIFYKYIKDFEALFDETVQNIKRIEEKKLNQKKISVILGTFNENMVDLLKQLQRTETARREPDAFPVEFEDEGEIQHKKHKLIVCGDPYVGKTSTILRFTDNAFRRTYIPTIGVNLSDKTIKYKNMIVKFVLWDIAGQSKFQKMRSYFYKGADGLILIFDLTSQESLENIPNWYADVQKHVQGALPGLILGNKSDLVEERTVGRHQGEALAHQLNYTYFECSALTGDNITESFLTIAEALYTGKKVPPKKRTKKKKTPAKKKKTPAKKKKTPAKKKKTLAKKKKTPAKKKKTPAKKKKTPAKKKKTPAKKKTASKNKK